MYQMVKLFMFLLAMVAFNSGYAQQLPARQDTNKLKPLVRKIAKDNVYIVSPKNIQDKKKLKQFSRYEELATASPFNLMHFAYTNPNAIVRLYAFRALSKKMDNLPGELAIKFKEDTTLVIWQSGDEIREKPVNEIANGFLK